VSVYRFIQAEKATWPVRLQCRTLGIARSAYNEWAKGGEPSALASENKVLAVHIRAMHRRSRGTYGSPRIHADLVAEGHQVGKQRVARLMKELGLSGTPKRRFKGSTTDSDHDNKVAKNLLARNFTAERPNQAWVGDITYLRVQHGWVYLAVLIDLFSRKVVGWKLESHMEAELCVEALNHAVATREPDAGLIHHTDRGSQYTSAAYQASLEKIGAVSSMSRKGNCWDNAVTESFFGTFKQELAFHEDWNGLADARAATCDYIESFYNRERLHSTLGYKTPMEADELAA